jgi:hypothetical protein
MDRVGPTDHRRLHLHPYLHHENHCLLCWERGSGLRTLHEVAARKKKKKTNLRRDQKLMHRPCDSHSCCGRGSPHRQKIRHQSLHESVLHLLLHQTLRLLLRQLQLLQLLLLRVWGQQRRLMMMDPQWNVTTSCASARHETAACCEPQQDQMR